jgi:hypothetical protein
VKHRVLWFLGYWLGLEKTVIKKKLVCGYELNFLVHVSIKKFKLEIQVDPSLRMRTCKCVRKQNVRKLNFFQ